MQRKILSILIAIVLFAVIIGAIAAVYLSGNPSTNPSPTLKVLTTFYPLYDFAQNIGGNKIEASILVPETIDVHDFELTPSSIQRVATVDILIYNGAGLEPWISETVNAAGNSKLVLVDSSQGIQLLPVSPEFQRNNQTVDPHIWLDPQVAKQQVNNILQGLITADPADSQFFTQNAQTYIAKLDSLDSAAINATTNVKTRYFVTFHEAFAYFAKRYNLIQIPIAGPFQEEPTPSDIKGVTDAIHRYNLLYVGYESLENPAISQSIASQTNATLVLMNPIEGLTQEEKNAGEDYLSLMQGNIQTFSVVLNNVDS